MRRGAGVGFDLETHEGGGAEFELHRAREPAYTREADAGPTIYGRASIRPGPRGAAQLVESLL